MLRQLLNDQRAGNVETLLLAQLLYFMMPIGPHVINSQAVALVINNLKQLVPDVNQLGRSQLTFKHGILHSLTDIFTGAGNLTQPPALSSVATS